MAGYKIWYLGGYLSPRDDRDRWNDFGATLQIVFNAVATIDDDFRRNFKFEWYQRCTKQEFIDRWQSEETIAIILNAHSDFFEDRPAALAYDPVLEIPKPNFRGVRGPVIASGPDKGMSALRLDPKVLPAAPQIRALALLACGAGGRESNDDWEKLICPYAPVVAPFQELEGSDNWGKSAKGINEWIWTSSLRCNDFLVASGRWNPCNDVPRTPWHQYRKWSANQKSIGRDPLEMRGKEGLARRHDQAILSAWGFFRYIELLGPVKWIPKAAASPDLARHASGPHGRARAPGPNGGRKAGPMGYLV